MEEYIESQEAKSSAPHPSDANNRLETTAYETLFTAIPDAVLLFNPHGNPVLANQAAMEVFGFDPVELDGKILAQALTLAYPRTAPISFDQLPQTRALRGEHVNGELFFYYKRETGESQGSAERSAEKGQTFTGNSHGSQKHNPEKGQTLTLKVSAVPVQRDGVIKGAITIWQDVSENEQASLQLEAERAKLSAIVANAPGAIVVADKEGRVILTNPIADRLYAPPGRMGENPGEAPAPQMCYPDSTPYHPDDLPLTRSALYGETQINLEMLLLWPDGQQRFLQVNAAPILDRKGKLNGAIGVYQDITRRKHDQAQAQHDSLRVEIQDLLAHYREMERLSISRELHDGPLQDLVGLLLALKDAQEYAEADQIQPDLLRDKLNTLKTMIVLEINKLREFCYALRPPTLAPFGLEKAIRSHAGKVQEKHPEVAFHLDLVNDGQRLSEKVRLWLYRIYEELLENVLGHARATEVQIRFDLTQTYAELSVQDNGQGFEMPSQLVHLARMGRLGLVEIQERCEALGGTLRVISSPGRGTKIEVKIPLEL